MEFVARSRIEAPAEAVFRFHAQPDALERLTPPWEHLVIEQRAAGIRDGDSGVLVVRAGPFPVRWRFVHRDYIEGRQFCDVQVSGPFRRWEHTHRMTPDGPNACWLEDRIEYELPMAWFGAAFGGWFVRRKLAKLFAHRHSVTRKALERSPK